MISRAKIRGSNTYNMQVNRTNKCIYIGPKIFRQLATDSNSLIP